MLISDNVYPLHPNISAVEPQFKEVPRDWEIGLLFWGSVVYILL